MHRHPQPDDRFDPFIRASGPQSNRSAKRKSGKNQREMKFLIEPIQRSANVIHLAASMIVFTFAQSSPAKIEAQHRKSKAVQRFHSVEDDFIVHGPAKQRVWMAD